MSAPVVTQFVHISFDALNSQLAILDHVKDRILRVFLEYSVFFVRTIFNEEKALSRINRISTIVYEEKFCLM